MLHIILGILKVIGIVLGVLLLLLLAAVLAIIFVPVRYQVQGEKQEGRVCARVKISWLLHLISASLQINKRAEPEIVIRLFGIRLPLFRPKKKKAVSEETADIPDEETVSEEAADIPDEETVSEETADIPDEETVSEEAADIPDMEAVPEETADISEREFFESEDNCPGAGQDTAGDLLPERRESSEDAEKQSRFGKIRFSFSKICDKIKAVYEKLKAFIRALLSIPEKLRRLAEKAGELIRKPQQLLELVEKLEAKEVLGDILGYIRYLLRHYSPRRISGFLRFSTGDPAVTAQLTGMIYLILPARADRFTLQPEFGDPVFETDISFRGHIRAVHLLRVLWKGFRNKKLRRMIHYRTKSARSEGA